MTRSGSWTHAASSRRLRGASSGGMISQLVGVRHPSRVETLTLCISTPGVPRPRTRWTGQRAKSRETTCLLLSPSLLDQVRQLAGVDWADPTAAVGAAVVEARAMAGSRFPVDEAAVRAWAPVEYGRQRNVLSFRLNTPIAETRTAPWRGSLGGHQGAHACDPWQGDPVLPYPHGVALAKEIPGATLLTIEGMGHELPRGAWPQIVPAIVGHSRTRGYCGSRSRPRGGPRHT